MSVALLQVSVGPKLVAGLACLALGVLWATRAKRSSLWGRAASYAGLAFLAALLARLFVAPPGHRVFYDEYEHLDLAWNLATRGVYAGTMAFVPDVLTVDRLPLWPPLAHLHYAVLFLTRGYSEFAVYDLNGALSALSVLAAAAASFALFANPLAAGLTAAVLAFSPVSIMYAATADLSSVSLLWTALAWLAVFRAGKEPRPATLWTAGLTIAAALHARPDGILLLPPLLWLLSRQRKSLGPCVLAALSSAPLFVLAWWARSIGQDGYRDPWTSLLARVPRQAWENLWFFVSPTSPRPLLLVAAVVAFVRLRREPAARALGLSIALYFGLYAAYSTAGFSRGSGDKYALALELPLALLAGMGAALVLEKRRVWLAAALVLYAGLGLSAVEPPRDPGYAASDAFLRKLGPLLKDGPPVLSFVPAAPRAVWGASVIHPRLLLEQGPAQLDPAGKGFLLLRDDAAAFQPADAAALDALAKALYKEDELFAETAGQRRRSLSKLTPRAR